MGRVLEMPTIGTLNEKPLHAALKERYARPGDGVEVRLHAMSWTSRAMTYGSRSRRATSGTSSASWPSWQITTPCGWSCPWRSKSGSSEWGPTAKACPDAASRQARRSDVGLSRAGQHPASVRAPQLLARVLLIREEEVRGYDAGHNWRRKGWGTVERRLIGVVEERLFETPADLATLLPTALAEPFTARQLTVAMDQPVWLAHKMIYCLRSMGELAPAGKTGRASHTCGRTDAARCRALTRPARDLMRCTQGFRSEVGAIPCGRLRTGEAVPHPG